jgi:uncharacterized membrane protein YeiH
LVWKKGIIGLHPVICIALGTMTACFGGVIRDILCNEIPVILERNLCYHLHTTMVLFFYAQNCN